MRRNAGKQIRNDILLNILLFKRPRSTQAHEQVPNEYIKIRINAEMSFERHKKHEKNYAFSEYKVRLKDRRYSTVDEGKRYDDEEQIMSTFLQEISVCIYVGRHT